MESHSKTVLSKIETRIGKYGVTFELCRGHGDPTEKVAAQKGSGITSPPSIRWTAYVQKRMESLASRRAIVVAGSIVLLFETAYSEFILRKLANGQKGCSGVSGEVYVERMRNDR